MRYCCLSFLMLSLSLFQGSCTSVKSTQLNTIEDVAVVSMSVDNHIDMSGFVGLITFSKELAVSGELDLSVVTDTIRDKVFLEYATLFPFQLIDEQKVVGAEGYQNYRQQDSKAAIARNLMFQTYPGYQVLHPRKYNERKIMSLFDVLPSETDAVMFINTSYELKKQMASYGMGTAKVRANLDLFLINREGEVVMKAFKSDYADGFIKFAISGTEMDTSKVRDMCINATGHAFDKMATFLTRKFK